MSRAVTEIANLKDLSPADASAKLKDLSAAYRGAASTPAADKLASLVKDPAFLRTVEHGGAHGGSEGVALPGGAAFDQIQGAVSELNVEKGSLVDLAMAGITDVINDSKYLEMKKTVDALRMDGIGDSSIRQLIGNEPVSREEHNRVAQWKRDAMENPTFVAAFLNGLPAAVRAMTNAHIVLSSPIKEAEGT
jgi:hypothetical protein